MTAWEATCFDCVYLPCFKANYSVLRGLVQKCQHTGLQSAQKACAFAGSQALVAYSLQSSLPSMQFSMVAEEDSADLRSLHNCCSVVLSPKKLFDTHHCSSCSVCSSITHQQPVHVLFCIMLFCHLVVTVCFTFTAVQLASPLLYYHCLLFINMTCTVQPAALHAASCGSESPLQYLDPFISTALLQPALWFSPLASSAIAEICKTTPSCCPTQCCVDCLCPDSNRKTKKKRKDYTFRRQLHEKSSIVLDCPDSNRCKM